MPRVSDFYSVNEAAKPAANRVHHNNSLCPSGRDIPAGERRLGHPYRLCEHCERLAREGR